MSVGMVTLQSVNFVLLLIGTFTYIISRSHGLKSVVEDREKITIYGVSSWETHSLSQQRECEITESKSYGQTTRRIEETLGLVFRITWSNDRSKLYS